MPYNDTDLRILVTFSEEMVFGFIEERYNIFHRNPNRINISQHAPNVNLQRFAAASLRDVLYYEASFVLKAKGVT